jgi:hypothetical protein
MARAVAIVSAGACTLVCGVSGSAHAEDPKDAKQTSGPVAATAVETFTVPPLSIRAYLQYGVALAVEDVASAGPLCKSEPLIAALGGATPPNCILGSGGGVAVRIGWRPSELVYLGGAYEMTKQDPNQLYRLGILQQARIEWRRYFPIGRESAPFVLVAGGLHGYGNEWSIDTWGPNGTLGGGLEIELGGPVLDLSLAYRAMYFRGWVDTSQLSHNEGVAHFLGFEVSLEAKDAL